FLHAALHLILVHWMDSLFTRKSALTLGQRDPCVRVLLLFSALQSSSLGTPAYPFPQQGHGSEARSASRHWLERETNAPAGAKPEMTAASAGTLTRSPAARTRPEEKRKHMSPKQTIETIFAAFGRGDIPGILAHVAPDCMWRQPKSLPWGGNHRGPEGAQTFFARLNEACETTL